MLIIYLWKGKGRRARRGGKCHYLLCQPVSAARAGPLGSSPEDAPHSPWLPDLFGAQFQSRGARLYRGAAGWAHQGMELNLWGAADGTWALTVDNLIHSCGTLGSLVVAALLASEETDWGLWSRGSLSLSTKIQAPFCK